MKVLIAILMLLIAMLQYRLWFGDGNILEFRRLHGRIQELKQDGAKRRDRNAALEAEVIDLKQGLDAIEERARQDLGMIKEGETFVQIIDSKLPASAPRTVTPVPESAPKAPQSDSAKPRRRRVRRGDDSTQTSPKPVPGVDAVSPPNP